jgi:hypothetical protein
VSRREDAAASFLMIRSAGSTMAFRMNRVAAKKEAHTSLSFERMETRALMAAGATASLSAIHLTQVSPTATVVPVSTANKNLLNALQTFLTDLEATFGPNGTGATAAATKVLRADLAQISALAGNSSSSMQAVQRLNSDVTAIANTGTITAPQKATLLSDLGQLAVGSGLSSSNVNATANQILGVGKLSGSAIASSSDLTNPNALGTPSAGQTRGQDTSSDLIGPSTSSSSALPGGGIFGESYHRLLQDLKAQLAKSQALTSDQIAALRRDFSEIATLSHRPTRETLSTLKADLDATSKTGLTAASKGQIATDIQSVLKSAGLSDTLINRTLVDFQPVLDAGDIHASAVNTILSDLANLLAARPRSTMPLGSWFLGK